jgi:tight adherence protein B
VTSLTFWFGRTAALLAAVLVTALTWSLVGGHDAPLRRALSRRGARLDETLRFLRARIRGRHVLWAQGGLCVGVAGAAALIREPLLALALPLVLFGPTVLFDRAVSARTAQVEQQLDGWLGAVANSLKASASLGEALAASVSLVPAPMSDEIAVMMKEYELGTPLDEAVQRFAERVPSKAVEGAVLALKVARRSGGNLPEMLENASAALRELARLEGVVRTKTAEGKAQVVVIALIPIPLVCGVRWSDPGYFDPLVVTFVGHLVIGGAVLLWLAAILLARKILTVDV